MKRILALAGGLGLSLLVLGAPLLGQDAGSGPGPAQKDGFFRQYVPGLLARTNYEAPSTGRYRIALWDLLVGPGKTSQPVKLPGGAVIEVRSGAGRATIDGQAREISGGATFAVDQGSSLALANTRDDLGLALRVTLISVRAP